MDVVVEVWCISARQRDHNALATHAVSVESADLVQWKRSRPCYQHFSVGVCTIGVVASYCSPSLFIVRAFQSLVCISLGSIGMLGI